MREKSISVLIPDGECYLLKAVVNGLTQVQGLKIYAMSKERNNDMRYSRHLHKYSYYPKTDSDLDWIDNINKESKKYDIDIVMPIWDADIKILLEHSDKILYKYKLALLPSLSSFSTARNEGLLAAHLKSINIAGPKSVYVNSIDQLDKIDPLNFPMLIKPVEGFAGGDRISLFNNKEEIKTFFTGRKIDYSIIAQEYIKGQDFSCNVLCKEGVILAITMQKGNMPDEKKFASQLGVDFLYEPEVFEVAEKLMKSLNWSGVACIDMLYNESAKQYNVLEINTRFWGSLEGSILAGVNFPYLYCLASMGIDFNKPKYTFIKYLSTKGLMRKVNLNKKFLFNLGFIFHNTPLKFALKDPLPMLYLLLFKKR